MRKLCFTSDRLKLLPGEEKTNPGRYGKVLAEWVKRKLVDEGYIIEEAPIPEDWGWIVTLKRKPFSLWVGCGNEEGSTIRWCLFVEAETGLFNKLFNRTNPFHEIKSVESTLENIVLNEGFGNVKWEDI
jgi:hypothetical protein